MNMKLKAVLFTLAGLYSTPAGTRKFGIPQLALSSLDRLIDQKDVSIGMSKFPVFGDTNLVDISLPNSIGLFGVISQTRIDQPAGMAEGVTINIPFEVPFWVRDSKGVKHAHWYYPLISFTTANASEISLTELGGYVLPAVRELGFTDALTGDVDAVASFVSKRYNPDGQDLSEAALDLVKAGKNGFTVDTDGKLVVSTAVGTVDTPETSRTILNAAVSGLLGKYTTTVGMVNYNPAAIAESNPQHVLIYRAGQLVRWAALAWAAYAVYYRVRFGVWPAMPAFIRGKGRAAINQAQQFAPRITRDHHAGVAKRGMPVRAARQTLRLAHR